LKILPLIDFNSGGQMKKTWKKEKDEGPKSVREIAEVSERSFSFHV
jgi:predicted transcriptional regulator